MNRPRFLSLNNVLEIHEDMLARHGGGMPGVFSIGLLESAVAMPHAAFGGQYCHDTIEAMAAAYLFHLCKNHPFFDGNRRTALSAALAFLYSNKMTLEATDKELEDLCLKVTAGGLSKDDVIAFMETHVAEG